MDRRPLAGRCPGARAGEGLNYFCRNHASRSAISCGWSAASRPSGMSERCRGVASLRSLRRMVCSLPSAERIDLDANGKVVGLF